jgi:hypothetical protein
MFACVYKCVNVPEREREREVVRVSVRVRDLDEQGKVWNPSLTPSDSSQVPCLPSNVIYYKIITYFR